jgi:hypothetical protein
VVCLLLCLGFLLHVRVLSPRRQCLASLDMGMEAMDAVDRILVNKPKVEV